MPFGEVTITLEDVTTLTGLAIDGDVVVVDIPDEDWSAMCLRLLGRAPTDLGGGVIRIAWLRRLSMSYCFLHHPRRQSSLQEPVLSYLYREMGRSALQMTASSSLGGDFGGWFALLMIWTWERFPHTSPLHAETGAQITQDAVPSGLRWLPAHTRQDYNGIVIQSDTFRAVVSLICFSSQMWHHPDRVLGKFGMI
ncbi:unnamed protein product [Linum tenue]|uniref:Aminotransferase-like plant mobile domain-containing protein n=1 Tax=Linum tenue TaxID=586396 RepID=A0AAV0QYQ3_9ROSI|nr:unnamed protein product [Linum tenue]